MKQNKQLFTIFLVVFIDLMGFGLILPLLPFIAEKFSASPQQIGILAATYSLFQFIAGPILGRLSDQYGRKKLLVISQFGTFLGFLLLASANSLPLLFLSRIIDGITGGNISIAQAYIADITDSKNRTSGMGVLGAAFGLGFIIGPSLGGLLSKNGFTLPALVAAGISLISMVVTSMLLKETVVKKRFNITKQQSALKKFATVIADKELQNYALIFFLLNLAFSSMQGIFALWAQARFNWTSQQTGYLLGFVGLLSVISQLKILPFVNKKLGERRTLKLGIPLMAFGLIALTLTPSGGFVYLADVFMVVGNSFVGPALQSLATKEVDPSEYGSTLGIFQSVGSLARIAGPASAGFVFAAHHNLPFATGAVLILFALLFIPKPLKNKLFGHAL